MADQPPKFFKHPAMATILSFSSRDSDWSKGENGRRKRTALGALTVPFLSILSISCGASRSQIETGFKPVSYRSPQLDFAKVETVGIMPVNAYTAEVPELSSLINDGLPAELRRSQIAWKVLSHGDVLRTVNDAGLGRGYQNYLADLNTYASSAGVTPNFTAETKQFFEDLRKGMKLEALVFTNYGFTEVQMETNPSCRIFCKASRQRLRVNVSLYDIASHRVWWTSQLTLNAGNKVSSAELAALVLRAIANDFGKGALRQL